MSIKIVFRLACLATMSLFLAGCLPGGGGNIAPALKQIPAETQVLLAKSGMTQDAPIFIRIFKEESQLEIWKEKSDGRYHHFKTYPICNWSGNLGPKLKEGDKQSPEGFYTVTAGQMNPNSQFHLAFNLGYPNTYDRANGRTGSALMVHGDCRSIGCYAMTDALIEEIYAIAREAFRGGQTKFHVHAFPFRMTKENMKRHRKNKWYGFWKTLKAGYNDFELTRKPPEVAVCSRRYLVNAEFLGHVAKPDPVRNCPNYRRKQIEPFYPIGQGGITAKDQSAPETTGTARVAAYSEKSGRPEKAKPTDQGAIEPQKSKKAEPSGSNTSAALISSPPVRAEPAEPSKKQSGNTGSNAANADAKSVTSSNLSVDGESQRQASASSQSAPDNNPENDAEPETEQADQGPPILRGMHNVVESGKADMIAPQ